MEDKEQLANWIIANQDKKGSPEFETVAAALQELVAAGDAKPQPMTFGRGAELAARGALPPLVGGTAGFLAAGPPGALVGSMALPIMDTMASGYNYVAENMPKLGMDPMQLPSKTVSDFMGRWSAPPETPAERAIEAGGSALSLSGVQLPALRILSSTAATQGVRDMATKLSAAPVAQTAVSAPSAMTSSYITDVTENPFLGLLSGIGVAMVGGKLVPSQKADFQQARNAIKQYSQQLYNATDDIGVYFSPKFVDDVYDELFDVAADFGYNRKLHPSINAVFSELKSMRGKPLSLKQAETFRKVLNNAIDTNATNTSQIALGAKLRDKLDDMIINNGDRWASVTGGDEGIAMLNQAREAWSMNKKLQILEDIIRKADLDSSANYNQSGMETALRRHFKNLAKSKEFNTFNTKEKAMIERIVKGDMSTNFLRLIGKLKPAGVISAGISGGGGYAIGGPLGAVGLPALGYGADAAATSMNMNRIEDLQKYISSQFAPQPTTSLPAIMTRGAVSSLPQLSR